MHILVRMHRYYMLVYVYRCNTQFLSLLSPRKIYSQLKYLFLNLRVLGFVGIQQDVPEKFPVVWRFFS